MCSTWAPVAADAASPEASLQTQLAEYSSLLQDALHLADDFGLIVLYSEMQFLEKDYLMARRRPLMQAAFNAAVPLREAIELAPTLETDQKTQALTYLDNYLTTAEGILELDSAINSKFNEFDLQAQAIDPISEGLSALAEQRGVTRSSVTKMVQRILGRLDSLDPHQREQVGEWAQRVLQLQA